MKRRQTLTEGRRCEDIQGEGGHVTIVMKPHVWQAPGARTRQRRVLPKGPQREHGSVDTLIPDFKPPGL